MKLYMQSGLQTIESNEDSECSLVRALVEKAYLYEILQMVESVDFASFLPELTEIRAEK